MNAPTDRPGLLTRLRARLRLPAFLAGSILDESLLEELESALLIADLGMPVTARLLQALRARSARDAVTDERALRAVLADELTAILAPVAQPLVIPATGAPFVIAVVGVNGSGKTTTTGKLARRLQQEGHSVMLAACDTFRAAAVEQLQRWGDRLGLPVIAGATGADPAAVAHDAFIAARERGARVLLVDTAGRLHTQGALMDELRKVCRVLGKLRSGAPEERLLVLDGGIGQNALRQIEEFHAALKLTGLAITKLDGTAKGGILVAAAERFGIPVRFLGTGEGAEDLAEFDAAAFAAELAGTGTGVTA